MYHAHLDGATIVCNIVPSFYRPLAGLMRTLSDDDTAGAPTAAVLEKLSQAKDQWAAEFPTHYHERVHGHDAEPAEELLCCVRAGRRGVARRGDRAPGLGSAGWCCAVAAAAGRWPTCTAAGAARPRCCGSGATGGAAGRI